MTIIKAADIGDRDAYKLLIGTVVPRPIAWVTSMSPDGCVNAAPFSSYTFLSSLPPLICISLDLHDGQLKDTARNARQSGEFVVNSVTEELVEPMHRCSTPYPPGTSEPALLNIALAPSIQVKPPRIAASPISMECRLDKIVEVGRKKTEVFIGEVVVFHVADDLLIDGRIDIHRFHPLARLGGPNYARLGEIITMPVVTAT